jgi:ribosome-binding protein aMBF1 (putative translation factor)
MKNKHGWLEDKKDDPEFLRLCAREEFIEDFLTRIENEMKRMGVSRAELARRMKCKPSNVTQMFRRTRNLTVATMVDVAFHLKLQLRLVFAKADRGSKR